jgi:hypothetical protein
MSTSSKELGVKTKAVGASIRKKSSYKPTNQKAKLLKVIQSSIQVVNPNPLQKQTFCQFIHILPYALEIQASSGGWMDEPTFLILYF